MRFIKRPVEIEAFYIHTDTESMVPGYKLTMNDASIAQISGWMLSYGFDKFRVAKVGQAHGITIETLEGEMLASPGDWIIRGVAGEFYPIKDSILQQSYEAIEPVEE